MQDVSRAFEQIRAEDQENGQLTRYQELALRLSESLNTVVAT